MRREVTSEFLTNCCDFRGELPREDGSPLVGVGDVSGKGLKAALLVGHCGPYLRSAEHKRSRRPGEVLANRNESLAGKARYGFVTVKLANAGHVAPYCEGREIIVEPGLRLGVLEHALRYWESAKSY